MTDERFDRALDEALDAVLRGEPPASVLAGNPAAEHLLPLLEPVIAARAVAPPPPVRLAGNVALVRAAVQRAQMSAAARAVIERRPPWWRRRLSFASLSLPAGIAGGLALMGAAAAAAGTAAVTGTVDLPAVVQDVTHGDVPGAMREIGRGRGDGPRNAAHDGNGNGNGIGIGPGAGDVTPGDLQPRTVTRSGAVRDVRGNAFTLVDGADEWKVNIDAGTVVTGTIAEGGSATVTGTLTADKNLHADTVDASPPAGAQPTRQKNDGSGPESDRTPGPPPDVTTGPPTSTTPGPPPDVTVGPPPGITTGPPPDVTRGPPPAPGGSGTAHANSNDGGTGQKP
ncbi:MAG TPA: hypothetical protein VFC53_03855 [Dehalococcoidia bacterium]|nr:hypothetical protein [Dehalococcoidia bacterium]